MAYDRKRDVLQIILNPRESLDFVKVRDEATGDMNLLIVFAERGQRGYRQAMGRRTIAPISNDQKKKLFRWLAEDDAELPPAKNTAPAHYFGGEPAPAAANVDIEDDFSDEETDPNAITPVAPKKP